MHGENMSASLNVPQDRVKNAFMVYNVRNEKKMFFPFVFIDHNNQNIFQSANQLLIYSLCLCVL